MSHHDPTPRRRPRPPSSSRRGGSSPLQRVQHSCTRTRRSARSSCWSSSSWSSAISTRASPRRARCRWSLQQVAVVGALAVGQTLIILTAGIDLSVGAIMILAMMVMAKLAAEHGLPGPLALVDRARSSALLAGCLNGLLVTRLNLPPFIVTLGTLSIFTAIALLYSSGQSVQATDMPALLNWTGKSIPIGRLPASPPAS